MKALRRVLPGLAYDAEPEYETTTREETRVLSKEFERVTIKFEFVRGDSQNLEYDVFNGRENRGTGWVKSITDGIRESKRAEVPVEKLYKIKDAASVHSGDGIHLKLYGREVHEVVPVNVNSRTHVSTKRMEVRVSVDETLTIREDTNESIRRSLSRQNGDAELVEIDNE